MISTREELKDFLASSKHETTILKFTATWCKPCQATKPLIHKLNEFYTDKKVDYQYLEIDVDDSMDLYAYMKKMKMANGIPTILVYKRSMYTPDSYYIPFTGISGANEQGIINLFKQSFGF